MATLQAALKRGIEMTFQIEESELVAEPLPKQDDRKALLFYEAAEGGAGVLTQLATDPGAMAQVAAAALRLMHHDSPDGAWTVEGLPGLEQKKADGQSICEAGCYQCLLSYFNQPDHEHINRRNVEAMTMLVAIANAQVGPAQTVHAGSPLPVQPAPAPAVESDLLHQWLKALDFAGHKAPDTTQLSVLGGRATVAAQYKASRTLVTLEALPAEVQSELTDKGWSVIDMSARSQWDALFLQHAHAFH